MLTDGFDSKTMNIMRIILSYYEKKTDRILPDYLYLIAMPLLVNLISPEYNIYSNNLESL